MNPTSSLCKTYPERRKEIRWLSQSFGDPTDVSWPSVFIYGPPASGKSLMLQEVLRNLEHLQVTVQCIECYTPRLLYEAILLELATVVGIPEESLKCDNASDFVLMLQSCLQHLPGPRRKLVLVLEGVDQMSPQDSRVVLPVFLRLQLLTRRAVTCVLVSRVPWEKVRPALSPSPEPLLLHLPAYSKDALVSILSRDCPVPGQEAAYSAYSSILVSVFCAVCTDLRQLGHLALLNFDKYLEPIEKGEVRADDSVRLWRRIEPTLKRALATVYLRELSTCQWQEIQACSDENEKIPVLVSRLHLELPFYSKFLLIAAFLASYNPASSDRRFFLKLSEKGGRKAKLNRKDERTSNLVLGPKPFPLDRLLAIFHTVAEGRHTHAAAVSAQLSSLVSLRLLSKIGATDPLEMPRYKCLVSLEFIKTVARTVRFSIEEYLYDLVVKVS